MAGASQRWVTIDQTIFKSKTFEMLRTGFDESTSNIFLLINLDFHKSYFLLPFKSKLWSISYLVDRIKVPLENHILYPLHC